MYFCVGDCVNGVVLGGHQLDILNASFCVRIYVYVCVKTFGGYLWDIQVNVFVKTFGGYQWDIYVKVLRGNQDYTY